MDLGRYKFLSDFKCRNYVFSSKGKKGDIKKFVCFTEIKPNLFNVAFGDWDENSCRLIDDVRSNNGDSDKVLATIAHIIFDFMKHHPNATLYAEAVTRARTRLYQKGINLNWKVIHPIFSIKGLYQGRWEQFKCDKNYDAFILEAREKL